MKNIDVFNLQQSINELLDVRGIKLAYAIAKNKRIIDEEIKAMRESVKPSEAFTAYEKEARLLFENYAILDKNGKPKKFTENGQEVIKIDPEKVGEHKAAEEALQERHAETIKEREGQLEDWNKFLQEEHDGLDLHKVKEENLNDNLTAKQISIIFEFIE